ncbi:MAG: hypothetical protein U0176_17020 [Bacteroidia bacterium]
MKKDPSSEHVDKTEIESLLTAMEQEVALRLGIRRVRDTLPGRTRLWIVLTIKSQHSAQYQTE